MNNFYAEYNDDDETDTIFPDEVGNAPQFGNQPWGVVGNVGAPIDLMRYGEPGAPRFTQQQHELDNFANYWQPNRTLALVKQAAAEPDPLRAIRRLNFEITTEQEDREIVAYLRNLADYEVGERKRLLIAASNYVLWFV